MRYIILLGFGIFFGCTKTLHHHKESYLSFESQLLQTHWIEKTPLKGGLSNSTLYKVSDSKNKYVLRNIEHRTWEDREREIQAQSIASQHGYGPHLYAYDIQQGKILMSFLPQSKTLPDSSTKAHKLAKLLQKIHSGPSFCEHISILEQIKSRFHSIFFFPSDINPKDIETLIANLEKNKPLIKTATHRDLNPNNIIFDEYGDPKVIDFENAGEDDPFFDISTIIIFNFENTSEENIFLKAYFKREPTQAEIEYIHVIKKEVFLFYGLEILSKVLPETANDPAPSINFTEIYSAIKEGSFSLDDNKHLLIFAKSLLNRALNEPK